MSPAKINGRVDRALKLGVLVGLLLLMSFTGTSGKAPRGVELEWEASPSQDVNRYRVYWGTESRGEQTDPSSLAYPNSRDVGDSFRVLLNYPQDITDGTWYFAVTALDEGGQESKYSNEVHDTFDFRPEAPACKPPVKHDNSSP